jgi:hypothetical protein
MVFTPQPKKPTSSKPNPHPTTFTKTNLKDSFLQQRKQNIHESETEARACHIGSGSQYWKASDFHLAPEARWETTGTAGSTEISMCYVSDLLEADEATSNFTYPQKVEEIHLDGIITQNNFDKLIRPLRNLKLLEIHISSLENLYFERKIGLSFYLHLPNLESLSISSYHFPSEYLAEFKMDRVILNFSLLLRMNFPSLNFLAVSVPLLRHKEHDITESILKCIKLHHRTLKSLNIECTLDADPEHVSYSLDNPPDFLRCEIELAGLKDVQLHSFHFLSTFKTLGTKIWKKFLQSQRKLEYLQFWCKEKFYPLPTLLIHHNFRTLHTIALNIDPTMGSHRDSTVTQVDCAAFQKCSSLKTLVLKGKPREELTSDTLDHSGEDETPKANPQQPHFKNFQLIPKGLQQLRLIHLNLSIKDCRIIVKEMQHLSKLYLQDIGEQNGLGMSLEDLAYLLSKKERVLTTIDIHSGINIQSAAEVSKRGRAEGGGYLTIIKILFKSSRPKSFRALLGENDEYDVVEEDDIVLEDDNVFEDEILHEDFEGTVSENTFDKANSSIKFFKEGSIDSKSHRVSWLDSEALNEDHFYNGLNGRNSVEPIQLPRKSISRYIKSRQKALKVPSNPTIHEVTTEHSSKLTEEDEDSDFELCRSSSTNTTALYPPELVSIHEPVKSPSFVDAQTGMEGNDRIQ